MGWVFIFPRCVSFYLWSRIIPRERMNARECGSPSPDVLHTPWWDTGTSVQALSPGWQLRVTAISSAYSRACTQPCMVLILIPLTFNAAPCGTVTRVVLVIHRKRDHSRRWMGFLGGFLYNCGGVWVLRCVFTFLVNIQVFFDLGMNGEKQNLFQLPSFCLDLPRPAMFSSVLHFTTARHGSYVSWFHVSKCLIKTVKKIK